MAECSFSGSGAILIKLSVLTGAHAENTGAAGFLLSLNLAGCGCPWACSLPILVAARGARCPPALLCLCVQAPSPRCEHPKQQELGSPVLHCCRGEITSSSSCLHSPLLPFLHHRPFTRSVSLLCPGCSWVTLALNTLRTAQLSGDAHFLGFYFIFCHSLAPSRPVAAH